MFPQGLVERIDFDQWAGTRPANRLTTARKARHLHHPPARTAGAFELALIAGQFIFYDNNEYNFDPDLKNDSYLFEEQLLARYSTDWFNHFMVNVQPLTANG